MKEDFLHYLWKFKKFDSTNLKTFHGESITIINSGQYLQLAGPDFFNAQMIIGGQKWAGNVEIHLKSSDWYLHQHEKDPAYLNVILHVVWTHDTEIYRENDKEIPVLELSHVVSTETLKNYQSLITAKSWIFCERQLVSIADFTLQNWRERLFFERLTRKSEVISALLAATENDWEAVLFCLLAKNFGLNTNGGAFLAMAQSIPFAIVRKEQQELGNIEALLFGRSGLLDADKEDVYFKSLKSNWEFLSQKYQLEETHIDPLQFFKHRPDNFPTIRLAQLAQLYQSRQHLFSRLIGEESISEMYKLFAVDVSDYWKSHYQFDRESPKKAKPMTKAFIDLLLVNTIIPLQFTYAKSLGRDVTERLLALASLIPPEKNVGY